MTTMKKNNKATTEAMPIFVNCSEVQVFRMRFSSRLIWSFAALAGSSLLPEKGITDRRKYETVERE